MESVEQLHFDRRRFRKLYLQLLRVRASRHACATVYLDRRQRRLDDTARSYVGSIKPDDARSGLRRWSSHPRLFARLHARRRGQVSLLRSAVPLYVRDARDRSGEQFRDAVHLLGAGWIHIIRADRSLVLPRRRCSCREKGIHHHAYR